MQSPTSFIFFACSKTSVHANWELDLCRGSSFLLLAVLLLGCKTAKLFCFVSMKWGRVEACFSNKKSARRRHPTGLTAGDAASCTTRKQARGPGQRYQLLLQSVLMPCISTGISTGCKSSWYLWPAAIKGKGFGTGLKHYPVPKSQYRHWLVSPTGTKRTRRNRYRLVEPTGV